MTTPDPAMRRLQEALRQKDEPLGAEPSADELDAFRASARKVLLRHGLVPSDDALAPIADDVLAAVLGRWTQELRLAVSDRRSGPGTARPAVEGSRGVARLAELESAGVDPRWTWQVETGEDGGLRLVVRLAPLATSAAEGPGRLEAAVGTEPVAWEEFAPDEQGDLVVRLPVPPGEPESSLVLHLRWVDSPPSSGR